MSHTKINTKTQNLLWAISGGRCQYDGCNKVLYQDILTKKNYNSAYIAHIVGDKPDGPRGDATRSPLLANDIANLMLLCDEHHRLVDKVDVAGHPESRLLEMKQKHEARIARQTAIAPNKSSEIILYGANIGSNSSPLSYRSSCEVLYPDYYPASDSAIEIGLVNSSMIDDSTAYWMAEEESLCRHIEQQIRTPIRKGDHKHYSIFALAPQPLLIKIGTLLNDLHQVRVFQKHREPDTWRWQTGIKDVDFKLIKPANIDGLPVLIVGLSATINHNRITSVLGTDVSIWQLTIDVPSNDFLKTESMLSKFRSVMRTAFDTIKSHHGCVELHVFPAMPVSAAVEFGRVWMPKADMPMVIYDQNKLKDGFHRTITIN